MLGVAVMAPQLRREYDLSLGQTGLLISASLVGSLVSLIPWGLATDIVGERIVLFVGLTGCGVALLGASQVHEFWELFALLAVAGGVGASIQSASGRAVMHWFPPSQRGFALGVRQTAIPLSGFAVAVALPPIVAAGGTGWGFATLGIACLAGAVVGGLVLRRSESHSQSEIDSRVSVEAPPLRDRRLWRLSIGSGLVIGPQLCVGSFTVVFLEEHRNFTTGAAAAVLAVTQLLAIGGRIGAGRWSDARGSRVGPLRDIALGASAFVALTAALVGAPLVFLVPVMIVAGVLSMSWNGLSFAAAAELAGHSRSGVAIGMQQTLLNVPAVAYPSLFGVLVAASSWSAAIFAVALLPLAGWQVLRPLTQ
ncbi:MAG TPA: MFS transporter [Gaiellaceae bacterium]|nr:MFS transporter [Gaiellaceae bacterium]